MKLVPQKGETLEQLLERARRHTPTEAERKEQLISFAYGNVKLHNPAITRAMIEREYDRMNLEELKAKQCGAHLSDEVLAGKVRMLGRMDMDHEAVLVAARDRIRYLSVALAAADGEIAELKLVSAVEADLVRQIRAEEITGINNTLRTARACAELCEQEEVLLAIKDCETPLKCSAATATELGSMIRTKYGVPR